MLLYLKGVNVTPENPKTQTYDISADLVLVSILWDCFIVRLETDSLPDWGLSLSENKH